MDTQLSMENVMQSIYLKQFISSYNININLMEISGTIISRYPALDIPQHPFMHDSTKYENRDFIFLSGPSRTAERVDWPLLDNVHRQKYINPSRAREQRWKINIIDARRLIV